MSLIRKPSFSSPISSWIIDLICFLWCIMQSLNGCHANTFVRQYGIIHSEPGLACLRLILFSCVLAQEWKAWSAPSPWTAGVCPWPSSQRTASASARPPWLSRTCSSSSSPASRCLWWPSWRASSWPPPSIASSAGVKAPRGTRRRAKNNTDVLFKGSPGSLVLRRARGRHRHCVLHVFMLLPLLVKNPELCLWQDLAPVQLQVFFFFFCTWTYNTVIKGSPEDGDRAPVKD